MKTPIQYLPITAALAAVLALGACGREDSTEVEAQYDETVNTASEKYEQAKSQAGEEMDQAGSTLDDAAITAKVKSKFIAEPGLDSLAINVDTDNGVVTLSGTVDSREDRYRAEQIARATTGVRSISNRLDIRAQS